MDNVIQNINIEDIEYNNHKQYSNKEISELAASIKQLGLLEPITVRKKNQGFELVLGNKRYKAAIEAGLKRIPAIVKELDDIQTKEYLMINNDNLKNNKLLSNSKNLDVINLSKLNIEYERDEINMNNNQFNNNMNQFNNNMNEATVNNEPTFGGRFFPSLEDEPTNMSFTSSNNNVISNQEIQQPSNNFIDLTDLNFSSQANNVLPNISNNNISVEPAMNLNNNQSNFIDNSNFFNQNLNNNQQFNFNNDVNTNNNLNNNIIDLGNLNQNSYVDTQTINQNANIDNSFQEVINDFSSQNNNVIQPPYVEQPTNLSSSTQMELNQENYQMANNLQGFDVQTMDNNTNILNNEMIQSNMNFQSPELNNLQPNPESTNIESISQMEELIQPINESQESQKDVLPVINSLKALAVNLESFGYTIRITDEDLANSYKITIEVNK